MHRPRRLLRMLAFSAALAASARADEGTSPGVPPPPPPPATGAGLPPEEPQSPEDSWIDVGHAFVEHRIFAPVLRLDRFFSDERDIEAERSRSFLRWRSEMRLDESHDGRPVLTTGVSANLRLPGLNRQLNRLRFVITGETRDAVSALFPRTPEQTDAEGEPIRGADAGFRFYLRDTLVSHADLGAGVLVKLPPGVFGQLRFRWAVPITRSLLGRTALSFFWRTDTEFGTKATADLERPLSAMLVARLSGTGTVTELSRGAEWGGELGLGAYFGPRSGAQVGVQVSGATNNTLVAVTDPATGFAHVRHAPGIDQYRVYSRLRRDLYRRWFFLEIEPEVAWPWSPDRGRHAEWGVAFRVEVQFQGNEAPPPPPPKPPPEPKDPPPEDAEPKEPPTG